MSACDSDGESSRGSFYDDCSDFEVEFEEVPSVARNRQQELVTTTEDDVEEGAYLEEPIASDKWVEEYTKKQNAVTELENELRKRLSGELDVRSWCKCGNCSTQTLQNISECYCCTELDGCVKSLETDLVRQELSQEEEGRRVVCVTKHPGFGPVCLEKWSLRMAANRFKRKNKERYRQTGSEERFLRSISYREFSRLVYGLLGTKRIPLPAYTAIRKTLYSYSENISTEKYRRSIHRFLFGRRIAYHSIAHLLKLLTS